jgi:hypothetical protein
MAAESNTGLFSADLYLAAENSMGLFLTGEGEPCGGAQRTKGGLWRHNEGQRWHALEGGDGFRWRATAAGECGDGRRRRWQKEG